MALNVALSPNVSLIMLWFNSLEFALCAFQRQFSSYGTDNVQTP